ncbi:hypothetical protein LP7551_02479 [Roseibium album]|nr:hypothetical protein LP7551_02479 [Roseibium album]
MLVFWAARIAMRHNQENLYLPSIYGVTSLVECLAYVGTLLHYNTFAYSNFLASLQSYVFPLCLLVIRIAMITILAMVAERAFFVKNRLKSGQAVTG